MANTNDELFFKNGRAKKSLCLCLSKEKRAELKRLHGRDIIQCAGNSCPYYSVSCGRENIERYDRALREKRKFRLDTEPMKKHKIAFSMGDDDIERETATVIISTTESLSETLSKLGSSFYAFDRAEGRALYFREKNGWGVDSFIEYLKAIHKDWTIEVERPDAELKFTGM